MLWEITLKIATITWSLLLKLTMFGGLYLEKYNFSFISPNRYSITTIWSLFFTRALNVSLTFRST